MQDIDRLLEKLAEGTTTPEETQFLFTWLRQHRDQWVFSLYADYLLKLEKEQILLESHRAKTILSQIHRKIESAEPPHRGSAETPVKALPPRFSRYYYLTAAAAVLVLGLVGWWYAGIGRQDRQRQGTSVAVAETILERTNTDSRVLPIALPDGSSVWLYPNSRIRYASDLSGPERKVSLWGKAFFEVTPDPRRPFLVLAREMVTRVVGTSFTVDAFEDKATFRVTVKTGKVSVSAQHPSEVKAATKNASVDVVANQQAVFNRITQVFAATAVEPEQRVELIPAHPTTYRFREAPVGEILATLSRDYRVPIQWDKEILSGCALTTTLMDKPFFEKLRIICEAVGPGTYYTLEGESIQIFSRGCNN